MKAPPLKKKRTFIRKPVIGTKTESGLPSDDIGLKVFEMKSWLSILCVQPDVTKHSILDFINKGDIGNIECVKLTTKYPTYASFKVAVQLNDFDIVWEADVLPKGTLIKEFIPKRTSLTHGRSFLGSQSHQPQVRSIDLVLQLYFVGLI